MHECRQRGRESQRIDPLVVEKVDFVKSKLVIELILACVLREDQKGY